MPKSSRAALSCQVFVMKTENRNANLTTKQNTIRMTQLPQPFKTTGNSQTHRLKHTE